ncbi:MAG: DUF2284 domain-containing protein [Lachnoclostridium sp.]|nr:DUF2284 domain-containing protein [Lachnoclostridium sp.]
MDQPEYKIDYTVENLTVELSTEEYIQRFGNSVHAVEGCMRCKNYGKVWACPPFSHDTIAEIRQYSRVLLMATKITLIGSDIPTSEINRIYHPERLKVERTLREMEERYDGRAFAFSGSCLYCSDTTCTRTNNKPCRHPELVRSSLESYGFDVGRTVTELFGFPLLWSKGGFLPSYMTIVSSFFYNSDNPVKFP